MQATVDLFGRPHIGERARCIVQNCREVDPETAMIFTTESGMRSSWLLAALETFLLKQRLSGNTVINYKQW